MNFDYIIQSLARLEALNNELKEVDNIAEARSRDIFPPEELARIQAGAAAAINEFINNNYKRSVKK